MPQAYYGKRQALYVRGSSDQLSHLRTDCKMPAGGPETVMSIDQKYGRVFKGKTANLSETYTNEFADKGVA